MKSDGYGVAQVGARLAAQCLGSAMAARMAGQIDSDIEKIAREIDEYLSLHPQAADTLDGIVTWWLARQRFFEARILVEAALNALVQDGKIQTERTALGTLVYRKTWVSP